MTFEIWKMFAKQSICWHNHQKTLVKQAVFMFLLGVFWLIFNCYLAAGIAWGFATSFLWTRYQRATDWEKYLCDSNRACVNKTGCVIYDAEYDFVNQDPDRLYDQFVVFNKDWMPAEKAYARYLIGKMIVPKRYRDPGQCKQWAETGKRPS